MNTHYWRTTAYLGFASAIGIAFFFMMSAWGADYSTADIDVTDPAYRDGVVFTFFWLEVIPFTLKLFFFLALNEILIPPDNRLLKQIATVLAASSYLLIIIPAVIVQSYLFKDMPLDDPLLDLFLGHMAIISAFVVLIWGYVIWKSPHWPTWLSGLAFISAFLAIMVNLFSQQTTDMGIYIFSVIMVPIWNVVMSSYLLLRESSIRAQSQQADTLDTPPTPRINK